MKKLCVCILSTLFFFAVGCSKEDQDMETPPPDEEEIIGKYFTLSDSCITLADTVERAEIVLKANEDWRITGGSEWCSVSPASGGAGTFTIQIKLDKNQTYEDRKAEFTVEGGSEKLKWGVRQRTLLYLKATLPTYNISDAGGEIDVDLYNSMDYEVIIPQDCQSWISQITTKSLVTDKLKFSIAKHTGENERIGIVIFKDRESELADTIQVVQEFVDSNIEIPDVYFRNYCLTYFDENADGMISRKEAKKVTSMTIPRFATSLEGIKHFTELIVLDFSDCKMESVDLSKNTKLYSLSCKNVGLKELKLSDSGTLWALHCEGNKLTELSSASIKNLAYLSCTNNQLTSLVLGSKIGNLSCESNKLTALDLTPCSELGVIYCDSNRLVNLDLTENRKLKLLDCRYNNLKSIKFPSLSQLAYLNCNNNQLTSLDLTPCLMLQSLDCENNPLKSLRVDGLLALSSLSCYSTQLVEIDISTNTNLRWFDAYSYREKSSLKTVWVWKGFVEPSGFDIPKTAVYKEKQ